VDAHDHVVFSRVGVGDAGQREPGGTGGTVSYGDGLHNGSLLRRIQVLAGADVPDHPAGALELTAVTGQGWLDQIMPGRPLA